MSRFSFPLLASFKKHPTYMKIIFYFVGANVLVLAISFLLLYWQSSKTLLKEIGDHSESLLLNSARNTAGLMEWSLDYSYASSNVGELKVYALSDHYTDFETYTVWSRLGEIKNANPAIDSVYLINDYTDTVVDSRLGVNDTATFYDQDILKRLRDSKLAERAVPLPRTLTLPLNGEAAKDVITIVRLYEKGSSISAFVMNVDTDKLMNLLQNNSNYPNRQVTVLNDRNEKVFSTARLSSEQISELGHQGEQRKSGWELFKPHGQDEQLMVYSTASIKGIQDWTFIESIPKAVILGRISVLRNVSLFLFLVLFLASLTVIILISKRVYSPIQELVGSVMRQYRAEQLGDRKSRDELDYLSSVFTAQKEQIDELTEQWRHNKILGRERFLREFLGDEARSPAEVRRHFKEWEIDLPEENLSVAIFRIDRFPEFTETYSEKDRRLLRFAMANIVRESLQASDHRLQTVDMGNDHIAVVLSAAASSPDFAEKLRGSQDLLQQYLSIGTSIAWGRTLYNLTDMHEGYLETYELTQERFRFGHGALILKNELSGAPGVLFHLPLEKERQMAQAIQKGNRDTVLQIMAFAVETLRDLPYFECKMSLITLFSDMRRLMQDQFHQPLPSSWGLTSLENQIIRLETLENVARWMEKLLDKTLEDIAATRSLSRNAVLIEQVERLIGERLNDPNLSSKMLADELGLSVNYLRSLYKAETNRSITDTISERRLDLICRELLVSDSPIEPIIQNYGFSSLNTFYSVFKKTYGITPAQYRRAHKK
ncbi:AraC-like DNA-binding protein [Fontibacillus phaseoli]|uniref:AraC-like DNA-binding protein n=1 Tax=Fontibacillus phaseoli TaxID=1416533 RepID=A0A369BG73_9BACL|nr:helix-turn-helix transcriptional regulator [Fontibacillus phaseoli]RCX19598.1 AraC-like DNA-binding protein [Fontibacillus phaseoli]